MSLVNSVVTGVAISGTAAAAAIAARLNALRNRESSSRQAELQQTKAQLADCDAEAGRLRAEYQALLSGCGAGVFVLDSADSIAIASPEACRLLGVQPKQLEGRSLLQATLSADLHAAVRQAREQNLIQRCEIRAPGPNGSCMSITIIPPQSEDGRLSSCLVIADDVTELRRLETVRRDFVANVSHELRTPLTSIRAMAETLQDGALRDGDVADHFLGIISTEAQRLTRISEDLLILSHAESRPAETKQVNLSSVLNDVFHRFQGQAEKLGLELRLNVPPKLSAIGSQDQLEQVCINLIDNAIKYTQGGGSVCVSAEREGDRVAVHVADTGIGIMSQDVPRIFERFYRVDKARSRQSGGTGLGLAIVKHIVESHGGSVTVETQFNRGSTFTFTLPAA